MMNIKYYLRRLAPLTVRKSSSVLAMFSNMAIYLIKHWILMWFPTHLSLYINTYQSYVFKLNCIMLNTV